MLTLFGRFLPRLGEFVLAEPACERTLSRRLSAQYDELPRRIRSGTVHFYDFLASALAI